MSMKDLEKASNLIKDKFDSTEFYFGGNQSDSLITQAEKDIALKFPNTYKSFLSKFGYGGVNSLDIDGVTEYKFAGSPYGGVVWNTLEKRKNSGYPPSLIPIYNVGEGTIYCLDTSQMNGEGECPVVAWPLGGYEETPVLEIIAEDFGRFFLDMVERELEYKKAAINN